MKTPRSSLFELRTLALKATVLVRVGICSALIASMHNPSCIAAAPASRLPHILPSTTPEQLPAHSTFGELHEGGSSSSVSARPPQPDASMMVPVRRVADFIRTRNKALLQNTFADKGVTIIENFPPYVFTGNSAVQTWARSVIEHMSGVTQMTYSFEPAIDFSRTGSLAYFSLPTEIHGVVNGTAGAEKDGWAFVLRKQRGQWRVKGYGFASVEDR